MENLVIRAGTPADRADLLRGVMALQDYEAGLHETRLPAASCGEAYLDWMLGQVREQQGCCYLAFQAGAFVGFVAGWVERIESVAETADSTVFGYISDICILPGWRRQGLAQVLLAAAEGYLRAQGVRRLRIGSLAGNQAAVAAYRSAGFQPYEIILEKVLAEAIAG